MGEAFYSGVGRAQFTKWSIYSSPVPTVLSRWGVVAGAKGKRGSEAVGDEKKAA